MLRTLTLKQLDIALDASVDAPPRPKVGWLRAIRNGLGMTTRQLAARVGVTQAAVMDAESAEARNDITLATLQRYATALGCVVVYVLRPRRPLLEAVEAQATDPSSIESQVEGLRRQLLAGKPSRLWK